MPTLLACVSMAFALSSTIGVSGAMAEVLPGLCLGTEIKGQGSSLQKIAQEVWTGVLGGKGFNVNTEGCPAVGAPKVKYTSSSSGTGLKEWGAECGAGKPSTSKDAFIGTDEPPSAGVGGQLECIDLAAEGGAAGQAVVVPVLQAAVAVVVNPPTNCDVFGITNADLQNVWNGKITLWSGLTAKVGTTVLLQELVAKACESEITRVVRKDKSGTTFVFKSYLNEIEKLALCDGKTWAQLAAPAENLVWPENGKGTCAGLTPVLVPVNNGGSGLVEEVKNTAGSIGYANLGDARKAKGATHYSWLKVENGKTGKFEFPGEAEGEPNETEASNANCKEAEYTNLPTEEASGKADADWSKVSGAHPNKNGKYTICTLSYDVGLVNYELALFEKPGGEAQTASDFFHYVVAELGGQKDFATRDYRKVEEAVGKRAVKAAEAVGKEP